MIHFFQDLCMSWHVMVLILICPTFFPDKRKPSRSNINKEKELPKETEIIRDLGYGQSSFQNGSNSDDSKENTIFAKPRDPNGPLTSQEHYEQDEVLKIRTAVSIVGRRSWGFFLGNSSSVEARALEGGALSKGLESG